MVFKKYWSNLHKKHFNTITVNGINCVAVRVFTGCRLDRVLKKPWVSTNRHLQHFFFKINRNTKKWLVHLFNWIPMVSKCIVTVPGAF